jgi:predicted permease
MPGHFGAWERLGPVSGVVAAFAALVSVAVLGYLIGRGGVLRPQDEQVLSRLAFLVATPALMFTTVSRADLHVVFSTGLLTGATSVLTVLVCFVLVSVLVWRRLSVGEITIGALASSYVNAGNLGIPVGVYVLGNGALIAPILLTQLLVLAPTAFLILDAVSDRGPRARGVSVRTALLRPLRNPIIVASLLGLTVAALGLDLPPLLLRPVEIVGGAAVPLGLLAFGLSMTATPRLVGEGYGREVALIVALKSFAQPAVAYLVGRYVVGLDGPALLAATLFAALPAAQNVYVYSVYYNTATRLARGAVLITTIVSVPVMTVISGVLG